MANGFWMLIDNEELFLPFDEFPWFRQATNRGGPAARAPEGVNIAMRTVNNSSHGVTASVCPLESVSVQYYFGSRRDPCTSSPKIVPFTHHLGGGGWRFTYTSNPFGETISNSHKTLYFYANNPSVGLPFIEVNGDKVRMVQGELVTLHVSGATVRLHREGDRDGHKQMTIEIISMG